MEPSFVGKAGSLLTLLVNGLAAGGVGSVVFSQGGGVGSCFDCFLGGLLILGFGSGLVEDVLTD